MATKLSALIEEYLIDCRARQLAPKTIAGYASFLGYFASFLQALDQPDTLGTFTLAHARRYSQELSTRGAIRNTFVAANGIRGVHAAVPSAEPLKANTLFGYLRPLKTFSRWLADEDQGYLATDVMRGLKLPRRPKDHEEPLTEVEMGQLVAGYEPRRPIDARDMAICLTFLATGIRASELTGLLDADVHLDEEYLRVKKGKGGTSRAIVLPPEVVAALYRYRQHHRPAANDPHFFVNRYGGQLTYQALYQVLRRAASLSAIVRAHPHLLRHTYAVTALTNGMDLFTLKEAMGHKSIRTTEIYLKMSEERLKQQQRKTDVFANVKLPRSIRRTKPRDKGESKKDRPVA